MKQPDQSLAGSERYEDSKAHDKKRLEESKDNNKSLMNLKECVRSKAKMAVQEEGFVHVPFRTNKLTLVLKVSNSELCSSFLKSQTHMLTL